ncbi:alpha/beta hydrolase [Rathayibacter sp. AY1D2]|nr:alpha/beta hydrolase [Rathayibacter sp. AY1D2]
MGRGAPGALALGLLGSRPRRGPLPGREARAGRRHLRRLTRERTPSAHLREGTRSRSPPGTARAARLPPVSGPRHSRSDGPEQEGTGARVLSTRFTDVHYLDEGPADGTPLVLVHGFPDVPATWDGVLELVPPGLPVVRPFLRGVGRTRVVDPGARSGQVAALATDLLDLLEALDLGPVVLVGHDWGARSAHAVAALAPERVGALVTLATAYGPSSELSGGEVLDDAAAAWYRYWLCTAAGAEAFRGDPAQLVRWAWREWSPPGSLPSEALEEVLAATATSGFADTVVDYYRHGAGEAPGRAVYRAAQEALDAWPRLDAPTTFLLGTADGCETPALARANGRYFSAGRELIELDGVGHFVQREAPGAVAAAILRHLRPLAPSPAPPGTR